MLSMKLIIEIYISLITKTVDCKASTLSNSNYIRKKIEPEKAFYIGKSKSYN